MRALKIILTTAFVTFCLLLFVRACFRGRRPGPILVTASSTEFEADTSAQRGSLTAVREVLVDLQPRAPATVVAEAGREPSAAARDALPHTPGIEAGLQALGPDARPILEYKLGVLGRLHACLGERESPSGAVRAFFHFDVDEAGNATATTVELLDSGLPEGADVAVLACLSEAHQGVLQFEVRPAEATFAWATTVTFPIESDFAMRFVASDGAERR
jgi:hypothetical protein